MTMLSVLGRPTSINVRKVLWTCEELALPYTLVPWGSEGWSLQSPDFLARNPNAMVPVIDDDGFLLWESNTICRYLADRYGDGSLLPPPSRERALVERWMDWQASDLNSAWRYAFLALVRLSPRHRDGTLVADSIAAWNAHMVLLDRHLEQGGPFMAGEAFTLADVVVGLSVNRWKSTPLDHPALPALDRYAALLAGRPACARHCNNGIA